ncbi:unnamed protein product [Paramecium sonneborni]|uniref:Transmembrane protein n=1 Tax=Paramecium sonneborni TaxID=65129 RepID=A0A8S1QAU9_9CILI|nr:unnamed protein product [Paramecium sonneborni]
MFVLILIPYAICTQSNFINIGKTYDGQINSNSEDSIGHSYYFEISELINNADIIIIVSQKTPQGDPNIFLSLLNPEPYSIDESELGYCQSYGSDLCVIDKKLLQIDKPYYIGITCSEDCRYTLKVNYDLEQKMFMNDLLRFKMNEGVSSQVVKIQIDHNLDIQELEITGRIINYNEIQTAFHMYLNLGETLPSSQSQDYIGKDFENGHKYLILPQIKLINTNILTMIVESQVGSLIELKTQTYGKIRKCILQSIIQGEVMQNQSHHYQVEIQDQMDSKNHLQIKLNPYSGQITIYINFQQKLPNRLEDYQYQYKINQSSIIMFSDLDLNKYNQIQTIDIIIYGNELSNYEFNLQPLQYIPNIQQNFNYQGRIYKDQILQFELHVRSDTLRGKLNLEIESENNNVVIILRRSNHTNEQISKNDIINMDKLQSDIPTNLFIFTKNNQQNLSFELDFPIIAHNVDIGMYSVGLFLNQTEKQYSSYSFIIRGDQQFKILLDNTPYKSTIKKESYSYFQYILIPKENLQQIQIMLTSIQGLPILYSSTIEFPKITNYEQIGENNIITYDFKEAINKKQIFFISVYCKTASYFTITVIIKTTNDQDNIGIYPWEYTQIFQGDSQFHVLNSNDNQSVGLFKIDLVEQLDNRMNQHNKKKKMFSIHILSPLGGVMMYGFVSPSSKKEGFIWQDPNEIQVYFKQLNGEQSIFLRVELQEHYNYSSYKIGLQFSNWYNQNLQEIMENEHYFGYNEAKGQLMLSFRYQQLQDYTITKHSDEQAVRISVLLKNDTLSSSESTLLIPREKIENQNCLDKNKKQNFCFLLIQISSIQASFFTLIISHENNQISLHMDQIIHQKLPKESDHYYSFVDDRDSNIIVRNLNENVQLQLLVTLFSPQSYEINNFDYPYPQNESSLNLFKISKNFKKFSTSSISIYQEEIRKETVCSHKCMIGITIRKIPNFNYTINENSIYSIIYSSGSRQLSLKSYLPGKITKGYIAFYSIIQKKENVKLIILLEESNQCDATLIISKDEFPSQEKYDWIYHHLDQKNISITKQNNMYESMIGVYYVGVLGKEECHYYITYYLSDSIEKQEENQTEDDNFTIPYLLNQNQLKRVTQIDSIIWQFNCKHLGRLIIQLQYLSQNIIIKGSYNNYTFNQDSTQIVTIFKNDFQIIGYFPIEKIGYYYFQTSLINNAKDSNSLQQMQIRATLINEDSNLPIYTSYINNQIQEVIIGTETIIKTNPLKIDFLNSSFQVEQVKYILLSDNLNVNHNQVYFQQISDTRANLISSKRQLDQNISLSCSNFCESNTVYSVHAIVTVTLFNMEKIDLDYFYDKIVVEIKERTDLYYYLITLIFLTVIGIITFIIMAKKWKERKKFSLVRNVQQNSIEMIFKNVDQ